VAASQGWAEQPPPADAPGARGARPEPRPAELDEQTLVVRAQEGDVRSFEVLARRHQAALYRLAVRVMGDPGEAEDALQEALLDAWRRIGRFRGDSAFSTWMYRVVTNRCMGMLRRRRPVPVDRLDDTAAAPDSPERAAEADAGMAALGQALQGLRDELRICWVLRELEGLGYTDIAQITGASEDAVRGRIHRARVQLAEVMRPWR
jgi:RNA polymerase sigma-70 factor (ECF subfamily)